MLSCIWANIFRCHFYYEMQLIIFNEIYYIHLLRWPICHSTPLGDDGRYLVFRTQQKHKQTKKHNKQIDQKNVEMADDAIYLTNRVIIQSHIRTLSFHGTLIFTFTTDVLFSHCFWHKLFPINSIKVFNLPVYCFGFLVFYLTYLSVIFFFVDPFWFDTIF